MVDFSKQLALAMKGAKLGSTIGSFVPVPGAGIIGGVAGAGLNMALNHFSNPTNGYQPQTASFAKYGIEVEGGETVMRPDLSFQFFNGKSHEQGGIAYQPKQKGEFVFSDTSGYTNKGLSMNASNTFAALSKKYLGKTDQIAISTLEQLKNDNKSLLMKYGGDPMKYKGGGSVWDTLLPGLFPQNPPVLPGMPAVNSINPQASPNIAPSLNQTGPSIPLPNFNSTVIGTGKNGFTRAIQKGLLDLRSDDNAQMGLTSLALKAPSIAYNLYQGTQKDVEPLRINREGQNAINLMSGLRYDPTQVYSAMRQSSESARQNISGQNVSPFLKMALNQGVTNDAMNGLANANLQGQQMNNQYRMQEAQTRFSVGAGEANERIRKQTADQQNKAAANSFTQAGLNDIARLGDTYNKYRLTTAMNSEMGQALQYMARNFGVNMEDLLDFINKRSNGQPITFTQ